MLHLMKMWGTWRNKDRVLSHSTKQLVKVLGILVKRIKVGEYMKVNEKTVIDNGTRKTELEEMIGTTIEVQIHMYLPEILLLPMDKQVWVTQLVQKLKRYLTVSLRGSIQ